MLISIIICTYNRCESLKDTLQSFINQKCGNGLDYEVIVVDNNSKDKTKEIVESYNQKLKGLRYVFEPTQGISNARNKGIEECEGGIIAFIDDDAIANHDWIKKISEYFNNYPDISGLAGKVLPKFKCKKPNWISFEKDFLLKGPLNYYDHGEESFITKPYDKQFLGTNMALRKEVFLRNGLFNEEIKLLNGKYIVSEDSEYYHYISSRGEKIMYASDVIVEHVFDAKRLNKKYFRDWYYRVGTSAVFMSNNEEGKKILNVPFWLIKESMDTLIKSLASYLKCDWVKGFFYEIQLIFNVGRIRGYLLYEKYSASNLRIAKK